MYYLFERGSSDSLKKTAAWPERISGFCITKQMRVTQFGTIALLPAGGFIWGGNFYRLQVEKLSFNSK